MAISNRITIDGKQYKVLAPGYKRASKPPKTVRTGVLGNTIVSMGPGQAERPVQAVLFIPYEPLAPWGALSDLEAAMLKPTVSYTDHITGEPTKWGSGTYNITLIDMEVIHIGEAPRPEPGYTAAVQWVKVLS